MKSFVQGLLLALLLLNCGATDLTARRTYASQVRSGGTDLYVATLFEGSVLHFDGVTGRFVNAVVNLGQGAVSGVAVGPDCNLYVGAQGVMGGLVLRFNATSALIGSFVPPDPRLNGGLFSVSALAFGPDGNLYVVGGNIVLRYQGGTGRFIGAFASAPSSANYMTFGPRGDLYLSTVLGVLAFNGRTGATLGSFTLPAGLPFGITSGPDGYLYVVRTVDFGTVNLSDVLRYAPEGTLAGVFVSRTSGGLGEASDLAFGPDGNLYVLATSANKVLRYNGHTGSFIGTFAVIPGPGGLPHHLVFRRCR